MIENIEYIDKNISTTLDYINSFNDWEEFTITSNSSIINKTKLKLKKGKRGFKFEQPNFINADKKRKTKKVGLGFFEPFSISNPKRKLKLNRGISSHRITRGSTILNEGIIWNINENFKPKQKKHHRLVLPGTSKSMSAPQNFIESTPFKNNEKIYLGNLILFKINKKEFHLLYTKYEKKTYLIIDAKEKLSYPEFEKSIGTIIYSLGFVSGKLFRSELYIFQSTKSNFNSINGFHYRRIEDSIFSEMTIIPHNSIFGDHPQITKKCKLKQKIFGSIVSNSFNQPELLRAMKIISQGNNLPLELRTSVYAVALETVRTIINTKHEEKINPFKRKALSRETSKKLIEIINEIPDNEFNNKNSVMTRLKHLNQVGNTDSFKKSFEVLNIKLTKDDLYCIAKRNDFLHGRLPFEDEAEFKQNAELKHIADKLHFLISCLILKNSNFSGMLLNKSKFYSLRVSQRKIEEEALRVI